MVIAEQKYLPTIETEPGQKPTRSRMPGTGAAPGTHWMGQQSKAKVAVIKCTLLTLAVIAGFAICLFYTYQATRIIALGYQIDKATSSVSQLQHENNQLELKIAELQAPERVEQIATAKLGMKEPQEFMIVSYSQDQLSSQKPQVQAASSKSSWSSRLLAAIPRFMGQAEASPR